MCDGQMKCVRDILIVGSSPTRVKARVLFEKRGELECEGEGNKMNRSLKFEWDEGSDGCFLIWFHMPML